ncbi:hypothetical protein ABE843_005425, partial [Salmonella enterica]|nr:hypothetical protein [Salmonella enterica]
RQPVTRPRDLHPSRTLARWRGSAEHPGASAQQCARPASWRQRSARRCTCTAPARHPPSRSAPIPDAGAVARERRTSGGICAAARPASITAAAVSPALYLHRASPSPALAICTHPGRWRGGAGAPSIRGHLRGSAPGQHHGGSGHPGAVPAPRQPVTRPRDLHPSRTLARWRGSAEHPGASARQCARPASRRQRSSRRCTCTVPARHPPSRSAPIPDAGAVAKYQNKVCSYEAEKSRIVDLRMRKFMRSIVLKILRNLRSWIALVVRGFENAYDTYRYHKER